MKQRKYFIILPISVNHGSVMMVGEHTVSQREVSLPPSSCFCFSSQPLFFSLIIIKTIKKILFLAKFRTDRYLRFPFPPILFTVSSLLFITPLLAFAGCEGENIGLRFFFFQDILSFIPLFSPYTAIIKIIITAIKLVMTSATDEC